MPTEVVSALIAAGGAVLSAFIAWFVSRASANKEIEKLKLTWAREDVVTSDEDFSSMCAAVSRYTNSDHISARRTAVALVSSVRSKEHGQLAERLDELYQALLYNNAPSIEACLTKVIEEKRKAKGYSEGAH